MDNWQQTETNSPFELLAHHKCVRCTGWNACAEFSMEVCREDELGLDSGRAWCAPLTASKHGFHFLKPLIFSTDPLLGMLIPSTTKANDKQPECPVELVCCGHHHTEFPSVSCSISR